MSKPPRFQINWRYAIGEFLIVVLGIVAAFQMDAWKERREKAQLLEEYLYDIEAGLQTDSLFYGFATAYFKNIENNIDSTVYYLDQKTNVLPEGADVSLVRFSTWYYVYITNSAFQDLNNSGRLNLITDKELRYDLIAYYQYTDFLKVLDVEYNNSLGRMQEVLLTQIDFQKSDGLPIPNELQSTIYNFLEQKRTYISSYMSHRKTCQNLNNSLRLKIASILDSREE
ncbi:MAG: hypothetical protein AAGH79_09725 [Bacteroidota bacterium]